MGGADGEGSDVDARLPEAALSRLPQSMGCAGVASKSGYCVRGPAMDGPLVRRGGCA